MILPNAALPLGAIAETRSHRRSRVSFDDLPELDDTTSAMIDAALKKAETEEYSE
eukprot:COSAG05_NODE_651_length_8095_cov_17.048572_1_plen_54_part_10